MEISVNFIRVISIVVLYHIEAGNVVAEQNKRCILLNGSGTYISYLIININNNKNFFDRFTNVLPKVYLLNRYH